MGALSGITIVEIAGIGPGPFAAMMLADQGARVIRIDRPGGNPMMVGDPARDILNRGRQSLALDLKSEAGQQALLRIIARADGLIEGFRPGVMERMGLGPDQCLAQNPRLVYGRMTGWGQSGPLAGAAGHDINYIALAGALAAIGRRNEAPSIPLNLVGDFGGGALYLLFGMLCALIHARATGEGQVVDAAMVDGVASLMSVVYMMDANQLWRQKRGSNLLDGGAPFYDVYETKDRLFVSVGPLEPQFFALFLQMTGLADHPACQNQLDFRSWKGMRAAITEKMAEKTRQEWCDLLEGSDLCFAPVLDYKEVPDHPHMKARQAFTDYNGLLQPSPAPKLSRTPGQIAGPPPMPGAHSRDILSDFGFSPEEINDLVK
ncbi:MULTISPECIES: CaiB/BaiF CoA-transferase family protein [unclassified Iodidimonas]|jgi:alpha-methylacyl-CoA racemase|uniref:CaiB/BaiF CoA transferase family protein n=1 Tax=unclassified Iodidimonas TaxID=2626145 RepID=UPI0024828DEC|nr:MULTISPECIES: CaiB/BaiF CoA-transferase family protein [unclassified Iodidimonas]